MHALAWCVGPCQSSIATPEIVGKTTHPTTPIDMPSRLRPRPNAQQLRDVPAALVRDEDMTCGHLGPAFLACGSTPRVVAVLTYAGDQRFDVINMSFFVDDDVFLGSTEFKCADDPVQRAFRHAVERAVQYARNQGVTPVAALGNSDEDLAHPAAGNECEVVPAETQGVVGTMALGSRSEKAGYSNYGTGATDVAAPGGNGTTGNCQTTILSTFPAQAYECIQGTSMASPHTAGVAALIVSQFGTLGGDGDVKMSPTKVESYLQSTVIDIGQRGYDKCFGNGRINARRAVLRQTSSVYDATAPFCPEYAE